MMISTMIIVLKIIHYIILQMMMELLGYFQIKSIYTIQTIYVVSLHIIRVELLPINLSQLILKIILMLKTLIHQLPITH